LPKLSRVRFLLDRDLRKKLFFFTVSVVALVLCCGTAGVGCKGGATTALPSALLLVADFSSAFSSAASITDEAHSNPATAQNSQGFVLWVKLFRVFISDRLLHLLVSAEVCGQQWRFCPPSDHSFRQNRSDIPT